MFLHTIITTKRVWPDVLRRAQAVWMFTALQRPGAEVAEKYGAVAQHVSKALDRQHAIKKIVLGSKRTDIGPRPAMPLDQTERDWLDEKIASARVTLAHAKLPSEKYANTTETVEACGVLRRGVVALWLSEHEVAEGFPDAGGLCSQVIQTQDDGHEKPNPRLIYIDFGRWIGDVAEGDLSLIRLILPLSKVIRYDRRYKDLGTLRRWIIDGGDHDTARGKTAWFPSQEDIAYARAWRDKSLSLATEFLDPELHRSQQRVYEVINMRAQGLAVDRINPLLVQFGYQRCSDMYIYRMLSEISEFGVAYMLDAGWPRKG